MQSLKTDRRSVILGATAMTVLAGTAKAQTADRTGKADAVAQAVAKAQPAPALSIAVANAQGVVWATALGKSDLEFGIDATTDHRFRLGSVSKVLTATAAAKLASRGTLDLDRPIATWLTDLPAQHRNTTLKHLLTHRGGIRHFVPRELDPTQPGGAIFQRLYPTNTEILANFINDPLIGPPGAQVAYSTYGYTLASLVMETAAKTPFSQIILSDIGEAFGLKSLGLDNPLAMMPMRARGYSSAFDIGLASQAAAKAFYANVPGGWSNMPDSNPAYNWAGAGVIATPSDLARFGAALLDTRSTKITGAERNLLFTPLTDATRPPLGLGWRLDTDGKGRRRRHHAGATPGGRANIAIYPDQGLSIAIASNVMSAPGNVLGPSSDLVDVFS